MRTGRAIALVSMLAAFGMVGHAHAADIDPLGVGWAKEPDQQVAVSTNASDGVVEAGDQPTGPPPAINLASESAAAVAVEANPAQAPTPGAPRAPTNPEPGGFQTGLGERSQLTGDWGGIRSKLQEHGVTLDVELTLFYQGLAAGTGPHTFDSAGRLDAFLKLDTAALGLWDGGGLHTHLEYRFGDLPDSQDDAFFITNTGVGFPSDSPDTLVATSLYLSQRFGDRASLLIGKINALDLLAGDLFFGGWGIHRFWNVVFAAPPSGLVPPVLFGAIANVKTEPATLSFWVYDPDDRTQQYWPDHLFANGVSLSLGATHATEIAGRPTTFSLNGIYTTKAGIDFSDISGSLRSGLVTSTKTGAYNIAFQFSHLLHQNPTDPRDGWGVFLKAAIADGNPNYVQGSVIVGIGGTGLFRGRELDSFGVGYYFYNLSDALQDTLDPRKGRFGNEQAIEMYYSYAVTPWFYLTADLQYIDPPRSFNENAFVAGLRTNIRF